MELIKTVLKTPIKKVEEAQVIEIFSSAKNDATQIFSAPITCFEIPQIIKEVYQKKNLQHIRYTMEKYGQETPINVVDKGSSLNIVDGVSRYLVALELGIPSMKYICKNIDEDKLIESRLLFNQRTNRGFIELCLHADYFLTTIGKSQGKKRETLGFNDLENDKEFGLAGKDRFELTCALLNLPFKASTLRCLMEIFWVEYPKPPRERLGLFELLDENKISISKAHKLIKSKKLPENQEKLPSIVRGQDDEIWFRLYNKSSLKMDEIPNDSVRLCVNSHPYFQLRKYRNQDEIAHGQEKTSQGYVINFIKHCREVKLKLQPGGVLVTVIGETYRNGYQGICTKVETALENDGWIILDQNVWQKTNPKFTPHPNRFINAHEKIIVAQKPGGDVTYKDVKRESSTKKFQVKKSKGDTYYLATPETCITNVITTSVHNTKELTQIDEDFTHDAPCPESIYEDFIEAYSNEGDTVLDNFLGSGTAAIALAMGRNLIGYDIDQKSIAFAEKRCQQKLSEYQNKQIQLAA